MATNNSTAHDALIDGINLRLAKARAICSLAGAAPASVEYPVTDEAIPLGMQAAMDLIQEAEFMANELHALKNDGGEINVTWAHNAKHAG